MTGNLARLGTLVLALFLPVSGCVCEKGDRNRTGLPGDDPNDPSIDPAAPPAGGDVLAFQFAVSAEPPLLVLWPQDPVTPVRKDQKLAASTRDRALVLETKSADSWMMWQFETPLHAAVLAMDLSLPKPGTVQVFWSSLDCPLFEERCSESHALPAGRQHVDFRVSRKRALREIRLDLPAEAGLSVEVHSIDLLAKPWLRSGARPRENHTRGELTKDGLVLSSSAEDPWLLLDTPELDAAKVDSIELEMESAAGAKPQLFWSGTECENFQEKCTVWLTPSGPGKYQARLSGLPGWRGRVRVLRLDPSHEAARYVIRRVGLTRGDAKK
jgi:hypothetical protein